MKRTKEESLAVMLLTLDSDTYHLSNQFRLEAGKELARMVLANKVVIKLDNDSKA